MSPINYTAKSPRGEAMHSTGDKVSKVEKESDSFTGAAHFGQEQIPERALLCLFARVCVC